MKYIKSIKRALLFVIITSNLVIVIGCNNYNLHNSIEDRQEVDALINSHNSIDSLNILIEKFKKDKNNFALTLAYKELGKKHRERSEFMEAIKIHNLSYNYACKCLDTLEIIQSLNNIGTNYRRIGVLDKASSFHYKALSFCEEYSDKISTVAKKNKVISLNGIGNVHLSLKNYKTADSVLRKALIGEKELNSNLGQAINYANLGAIFENQNKIDSARYYYSKSLYFNKLINSDLGLYLCYNHFGRLDEKEKNYNSAIKEYLKSYKIMENNKDKWHWLESCLSLVNVYIIIGDLDKAQDYLNKGLSSACKINSLGHMAQGYELQYQIFNKKGDFKNALKNFILSRNYLDSIYNKENMINIQNIRIQYERDMKQNEINHIQQNYTNEQRVKKIIIISFTFAIIATIAIIAFLLYIIKLRDKTNNAMQRIEKVRSNFFTNITHEFRTPLTIMLGYAQDLKNGFIPKGESVESIGNIILRQGTGLLDLINQLLDISKIQSSIGEQNWVKSDIVTYIKMIIENYGDYASQKKIELLYIPAESIVEMDFIPDYIKKIMNNLISNAIKFTPEYGKVYITSQKEKNKFIIQIADTGVGIDNTDLPYIFETFFQGENSSNKLGSGIGLSFVHQMIQALKGDINVKSVNGAGSIFIISLPINSEVEKIKFIKKLECFSFKEKIEIQKEIEAEFDDNILNTNKPIILIIEDNKDISHFIKQHLKDKYSIYQANNGKEGLEKANDLLPDIIITDIMMPIMDGYTLCKNIRENDITSHISLVIISAKSDEQDKIKGLEFGADHYLYKPFNYQELIAIITTLLNKKEILRNRYTLAIKNGDDGVENISTADATFLSKISDIVNDQIKAGTDINSEVIANRVSMTTSQLRRKIYLITGLNTSSYILQIRLNKAKQLLKTSTISSIGEIANMCGFYDVSHFSKLFKNLENITPSQYRKNNNPNI